MVNEQTNGNSSVISTMIHQEVDQSEKQEQDPIDIEHVPVLDDPRCWSYFRKHFILFLVSSAAIMTNVTGTIQTPAVKEMEMELPATSQQFSLSLSLYILVQGSIPLVWTAISEVKGRKAVYIVSQASFVVACIALALSTNIGLVIGFRIIQAAGSSALVPIGAATLADMFDPAERGTKLGIYYMAPLLGTALGPIIGGALTTGLGWRSIFLFLSIYGGASCLAFLMFFRDTFRKERSLIYQNILQRHLRKDQGSHVLPSVTAPLGSIVPGGDMAENAEKNSPAMPEPRIEQELRVSLKDVNPFRPIGSILRRFNNLAIFVMSGLIYALSFMIVYTSARTLTNVYRYNALKIGVTTLTFGAGCIVGSMLGGRWSDYKLAQLKKANGGKSYPEMRLKSTTIGILFLPICVIGFGWSCDKQIHVAVLCTLLFASGFFTIWMYASTLAYMVDANAGRSGTAVATNSVFRGFFAFVATEIAVPLQDNVGDGWLYTIWGFIVMLGGALVILVIWKGEAWRTSIEKKELQLADEEK